MEAAEAGDIEGVMGGGSAWSMGQRADRRNTSSSARWEEAGRAHGEGFRDIRPASTVVEVKRLIGPGVPVGIEDDAIVCRTGQAGDP
jgi:hypothetical protein